MPSTKARTPETHQWPALIVRRARGMRRGVFVGRAFRTSEVIEVCPALILPEGTAEEALCGLQPYVFKRGPAEDRLAVALGYGSLYIHSPDPNAAFQLREARGEIVFRSVRAIAVGEQILIDYRWEEADYTSFNTPSPLPHRPACAPPTHPACH